jgi:hypothetical protein
MDVGAFCGELAWRNVTVPAMFDGNLAIAVICASLVSNVAQILEELFVVSVKTTDLPTKSESSCIRNLTKQPQQCAF